MILSRGRNEVLNYFASSEFETATFQSFCCENWKCVDSGWTDCVCCFSVYGILCGHSVIFLMNRPCYPLPSEIVIRTLHTMMSFIVQITLIIRFMAAEHFVLLVWEFAWCFVHVGSPPTGNTALLQAVQILRLSLGNERSHFHLPTSFVQW